MLTEKLWNHLTTLTEPGPRPLGSPANQAAADSIRDHFQSLGYQVEEQPYPCTAWEGAAASLTIAGEPAAVEANAFSLPCDVNGTVLPLGSLQELETAELHGRILLFYGELASQPLSPKSWFLKSERDERIIRCLEDGQPAALLAPPAATEEYMHLSMDWELDLAAATVPYPLALDMLRQPDLPVHLRIQGRRVPAVARNIVARSSSALDGPRVVLCAHFDTMVNTPGAMDNASGVAVLLALAELLAGKSLPYGLEFVAFNGEEYLPIGDDEYLRRAGDSLENVHFALNIDGAGPYCASTSITMLEAAPAFHAQVEQLTQEYPGVVWVEPWPESNHSTFAMRGVPSLAFSSLGARRLAHTPQDDLDLIDPRKLEEVCRLAADIILACPPVTRPG